MDIRKVRRVAAGLILFGFVFVLSGCAIDPKWNGVATTDFSNVYAGMLRTDFESLTGRPIEKSEVRDCIIATYEYDRGYVGCVASGRCQEPSQGGKAFRYFGLAFGTIATLGLFPWGMWHEVNDCQTGYLRASYGPDGRLINIRLLDPEPYKSGTYWWDTDLRKPWLKSPCREVYYHPHPSTIPDALFGGRLSCLSSSKEIEKQEGERLSDAKLYGKLLTLCREADAGHTKAQFEIGRIYWRKNRIPDNRSKSYMWYMLAATPDLDGVQHQDEAFQKSATIEAEYKRNHVLSGKELNKAMQLLSVWAPGQCEHELAPDNAGN